MLRNVLKLGLPRSAMLVRAQNVSGAAGEGGAANQPPKTEFLDPMNEHIVDYEDPDYLPVPVYPARINEPLHIRKQRLVYQSRKRGMLENDLLLSTFAARYLQGFDAEQTAQYDQLINGVSNDWDIYYWATETKPTPEQYETPVMQLLKEHVRNVEKESRIRQPDLYGAEN